MKFNYKNTKNFSHGVSGFIGTNLVNELKNRGHEVLVINGGSIGNTSNS